MALGLELKLRMGLQLVMTPQLQMAIRLLQMSSLELEEYLQEELERNPLLDREEEGGDDDYSGEERPELSRSTRDEHEESESFGEIGDLGDLGDLGDFSDLPLGEMDVRDQGAMELSSELPVDANWTDIYGDNIGTSSGEPPSEAPPLENTLARTDSLADHLIWQLGLSAVSERERVLGMLLIDAIDDNGYLTVDLQSLADIHSATLDEMEDVLILVQSFEPSGVAARSLKECLLLQLKNRGICRYPYADLLDHLDDLGRRDFRKLGRLLRLNEDDLAEAVEVIQSLNPKPGLAFGSEQVGYVAPDVYVRKRDGEWVVEINPDTVPRLRLNRYYQDSMSREMSPQEKRFLLENARSAQWLIKSLEQRSSTIYRVAESIVRFQKDFLELGQEYLKPLILKDVADDIGVHESTASRVTSNKYMHTPRGIFELKYFFSSSLASPDSGESHSSEAVKYKIRKLVDAEPPKRPYSDEKLAQLLKDQGIQVARRTVAKYREALGIASSSRRKQLAPVK
ncbi:MAG: RNA polymerase factor sigma-54 [Magnetococcales bacterium]|nr:RNA polymerase factor sigma-54 [Magnetococcales bacterium]